jgi:ribose/xylose/arabinose/galactoside ABC-type transport system permease subunit
MANLNTLEYRRTDQAQRLLRLALDNWLYAATILLCIFFAFRAPNFLSVDNFINTLVSSSITGIVTAGFTIVLLTGTIDASTSGITALASVLCAVLFQKWGVPLPLTLLLLMVASVLMGLLSSFLVIEGRIYSLIATLGSSGVFLGLSVGLAAGQQIAITKPELQDALFERPLGIPISIWLLFLCYFLGYVMLNHTRLGAHIYATGSNYTAARLSGIPVKRVIRIALIIAATTTSLAAVLATARANLSLLYGVTIGGVNLADVFTAALLGGISLRGGVGKIERNLVAVLFLSILSNGLQLMDTAPAVWLVIKGLAFVGAVIIDAVRQRL